MAETHKTPLMLEMLFGETAGTAHRGASRRLKRWAGAFEEWLRERGAPGSAKHKAAVGAWRRLLRQQGKMPFELRQADVLQHAAWMKAEGYKPNTIYAALSMIAMFYRWCGERGVDAACGAEFNPAAGMARPKIRAYAGNALLSRGEVQALLKTTQADRSALGRREHAFFLLRLRTGAPLKYLRGLKWGQLARKNTTCELDVRSKNESELDVRSKNGIERSENSNVLSLSSPDIEAWVRWRPEAEPQRLPGEVWEAILEYLRASGRLAGIQGDAYIFAPLVDTTHAEVRDRAEAWDERRPFSTRDVEDNLKLYGRQAGIAEEKLNMRALLRTAIRLKVDEGASLEEMQAFMDSRGNLSKMKFRLKGLPPLPVAGNTKDSAGLSGPAGLSDPSGLEDGEEGELGLTPKAPWRIFRRQDQPAHGFYAQTQPTAEVQAVIREGVQGIAEEIAGLRLLARGLLDRQSSAESRAEAAQAVQTYTLTASRLAGMIESEKRFAREGKNMGDVWAELLLDRADEFAISQGEEPFGEAIKTGVRMGYLGAGDEQDAGKTHSLVEEVAATRLVLRRTLALAAQAEDGREYNRLAEVYGMGCMRLLHLLRAQGSTAGRLGKVVMKEVDRAIWALNVEWGWVKPEDTMPETSLDYPPGPPYKREPPRHKLGEYD